MGIACNDADLRVRLLNADGSEAEISGNGTRCVAAWYCAENERDSVVIRTGAGLKTCSLTAREGSSFEFRSSMGAPEVGDISRQDHVCEKFPVCRVSMGNPHYVVFVPEFELGWQAVAQQISTHHDFKHGMNVEFVKVSERNEIEVRFCERGVGETMSSGTGSCAAAVASIAAGKELPGARARSGWNADCGVERRSVSHRAGDATLSGRVFHLR